MKKEEFEEIFIPYVRELGTYIKDNRDNLQVELKQDKSLVTDIDRSIELKLRRKVEDCFPEVGFLGEEFGENNGQGRYRIIVDPIDGTEAFVKFGENYALSIGVEDRSLGRMIYGLVYDVAKEVIYVNGTRNADPNHKWSDDVIIQGSDDIKEVVRERFGLEGRILKGSSTALKMTRALWGEYQAFVSNSDKIQVWDVAGAAGIANQLGKKINGFKGGFDYRNPNRCGIIIR